MRRRSLDSVTDGDAVTSDRARSVWVWPLGLAATLTAAYAVWVATGADAGAHPYLVSHALYLPVGPVAVAFAAKAARARRGRRRDFAAWVLVSASLAAFWLGEVLWIAADNSPSGIPSHTWADAAYLLYYPLMLAALALLSGRAGSRSERLTVGLDAATVVLGGGVLIWYLVLRPALEGLGSGWGDAITVAYPVGDLLVIVGLALLSVRRNRLRSRYALAALLLAVIAGFAADLGYGYTSMLGTYEAAGAVDTVYLVSWFMFALAAALESRAPGTRPGTPAEDETPQVPAPDAAAVGPHLLPYLAIAFAIPVVGWALRHTFGTAESAAAAAAILILLIAMARQVVAMREGSRLREQQAVRAVEERLEEALRRTRFSVERAAESIIWLDSGGRCVDVNEAACRLLEYSREEMLGMSIAQFNPRFAKDPGRWERVRQVTRERGSQMIETEHRTKSGRLIPVQVYANHLDYNGEEFSVAFVHDATERKAAERALREAEAQLQQAQKMDAIGQLAGGIAHDFNNVLTAIVGYCDLILLSADDLPEPVRTDVEEIKKAAGRAGSLTRQILLFSRRQPLQPSVVAMNEMVERVGRLLTRTIGEHVNLVVILDPDAGLVEVDVAQFEQAITNLAVNARDAMPQGGRLCIETGTVTIDADFCVRHAGMRPGVHAVLAVSDTGVGMDEETLSHAFEPFFTTKEAGKGTGLGLATVYGTARQSGGGVFIYSEPGHGTTVKIYLPRVTATAEEAPSGTPAVNGEQEADARGRLETVLVVEDEAGIRELLKRVLEPQGYAVITAATADEALVFAEDPGRSIDLLLTDVILPGSMQGGELAQRVLELRPELPVLYMSGYTRDTVLQAGRLRDGMHYLEKPFSPDLLLSRVRELLDRGPGG